MTQPLVLAIEPDLRQAAIVKRIVKEKAFADIVVVDSRDAAAEAIRTAMPDVLLLSALLSPRDEDELMSHLRTLENAGHIQTHTIPQLASALGPGEDRASRGLFSSFRRKKEPEAPAAGCDPDLFAEEIRVFLQQAADKKREMLEAPRPAVDVRGESSRQAQNATPKQQDADIAPAAASSAWSSPFEWKPAGERAVAPQPLRDDVSEMPFVAPLPLEPIASEPIAMAPVVTPPVEAAPAPAPAPSPVVAEPLIFRPESVVVPPPPPVIEPEPPAPTPEAVAEPIVLTAAETSTVDAPVEAPIVYPPAVLAADPHAPVRERAEKIVALVQEQVATLDQALEPVQKNDEWTSNARDARINDRLGPLARWARKEDRGKAKSAPVTADDVRALIASLSVPPAVASVTYGRGCRIRRVRVPRSGSDRSDSVGAVILSRRLLAERRERRPSA